MNSSPPFDPAVRARLDKAGWLNDPRAADPLRSVWSGPDPDEAVERLLDFLEAAHDRNTLADSRAAERIAHLSGASRELMRQLTARPEWLWAPDPADYVGRARGTLAMVAADDLAGHIDVEEGGRRLSDMADGIVADVLAEAHTPSAPPLAVMAMGKWGGRELNYWSDIDLLFVFDGDPSGSTAANAVASAVMRRLGGGTAHGMILNADASLRPEGSRGVLARSVEGYRGHYQRWAEAWEFQALLKVRHAAGEESTGERFLELVAEVLWPETIDPEAIRSLRALKARVEAGADPGDLKRAPGGIRDIEFAIQMLQLVHGRFDPQLRQTSSLDLLTALVEGGYVGGDDADKLSDAYRWLRSAEHRLQLWDLRQTHTLPNDEASRLRLARSMGYRDTASTDALRAFETDLVSIRGTVRRIHEDLYFRPLLEAFAASSTATLSREGAERRLAALGFRDITGAARTFEELTAGLSRRSRLMQQMLPLVLDWLADSPDPDLGLDQLRLLATKVPDHAEIITTLHERPEVGRRLALLLGSSKLLGSYLDRIPEFVPRLGDDAAIVDLRPPDELEQRLRLRVESRPDWSDKLSTLRRFARRQLVRVAARDLLGMADVADAMTDLTAAADAASRVAGSLAGADEGLAIIAMGRWGGRELSYGSDLDLLFVYDDPHDAGTALAAAQEFGTVLARPGQDGQAWEIDSHLRPEGRSGPLTRSLGSYRAYYERWGQTWESQALVKARPVAGDAALGVAFMDMIASFVWRDPLPSQAITDIRVVKARVEKERIPPGQDPDFHLKLGRGGLVDIEFCAQLLQLRHGGAEPWLRATGTLEALFRLGRHGVLTDSEAYDLTEAYTFCSRVRNRLFLQTGHRVDSLPVDPTEATHLAVSLGYERRADLREDYRRVTRRARRIFEDRFYS
ncbi:bifunctional [glutamine synthetase] adenylyltransferase/[glutamine synthetase]-adenylyl-L-tyrosine phosphorylase [soil metagenome]